MKYSIIGGFITTFLVICTSQVNATVTDGVFGDYFQNISGLCTGTNVVTGFSPTAGAGYLTKQCTSLTSLLGTFFASSTSPAGQAMIGFNAGGSPKFVYVNWNYNLGNITFTGSNVGIGSAAIPSQKLDVTGNIVSNRYIDKDDATYYIDPASTSYANDMRVNILYDKNNTAYYVDPKSTTSLNAVYAYNYYYHSDKSLKKNIIPIASPLEKILSLTGYTFTWKDSGKNSIGVIAQEVEKVFPEIVVTNPKSHIKSVEYGNLVAPIIEAIKELALQSKDQETINESQKQEISQLKSELAILKKEIEILKKVQ